jgi:hypothetical protein
MFSRNLAGGHETGVQKSAAEGNLLATTRLSLPPLSGTSIFISIFDECPLYSTALAAHECAEPGPEFWHRKIFSGTGRSNSHQNSHSIKIKLAADLAASHLILFMVLLAPQVGLEPTTLRLTGVG